MKEHWRIASLAVAISVAAGPFLAFGGEGGLAGSLSSGVRRDAQRSGNSLTMPPLALEEQDPPVAKISPEEIRRQKDILSRQREVALQERAMLSAEPQVIQNALDEIGNERQAIARQLTQNRQNLDREMAELEKIGKAERGVVDDGQAARRMAKAQKDYFDKKKKLEEAAARLNDQQNRFETLRQLAGNQDLDQEERRRRFSEAEKKIRVLDRRLEALAPDQEGEGVSKILDLPIEDSPDLAQIDRLLDVSGDFAHRERRQLDELIEPDGEDLSAQIDEELAKTRRSLEEAGVAPSDVDRLLEARRQELAGEDQFRRLLRESRADGLHNRLLSEIGRAGPRYGPGSRFTFTLTASANLSRHSVDGRWEVNARYAPMEARFSLVAQTRGVSDGDRISSLLKMVNASLERSIQNDESQVEQEARRQFWMKQRETLLAMKRLNDGALTLIVPDDQKTKVKADGGAILAWRKDPGTGPDGKPRIELKKWSLELQKESLQEVPRGRQPHVIFIQIEDSDLTALRRGRFALRKEGIPAGFTVQELEMHERLSVLAEEFAKDLHDSVGFEQGSSLTGNHLQISMDPTVFNAYVPVHYKGAMVGPKGSEIIDVSNINIQGADLSYFLNAGAKYNYYYLNTDEKGGADEQTYHKSIRVRSGANFKLIRDSGGFRVLGHWQDVSAAAAEFHFQGQWLEHNRWDDRHALTWVLQPERSSTDSALIGDR